MNESAERKTSADKDRFVLNSWHEWEVDEHRGGVPGHRRVDLHIAAGRSSMFGRTGGTR